METRLAALLFAIVSVYIVFNRGSYQTNMYSNDATGYYIYLPSTLIYNDPGHYKFYTEVNKKYNLSGDAEYYALYEMPNGRRLDKYAIGTSLFELPLFIVAHLYCITTHSFPPDGYSTPYQFAGIFSFIIWVSLGLLFLGEFLKRHFSDMVSTIAVLCIAFATNLYCYTIFAPGMSHPFLFFLFAAILYHTERFYSTLKKGHVYWLGILAGFVIITRPVDIAIVLMPLLWEVYDRSTWKARFRLLRERKKDLGIATLLFLMIAFIQMSYWKYASGHWIWYSYQGESFNFLHPHVFDGLFSYQKGWFVYTPVAFIALFGLLCMYRKDARFLPGTVIFLSVFIYIVFSWRQWWYGGGFGSRPLIEALPVVGFVLAFLLRQVFEKWRSAFARIMLSLMLSVCVLLNLFQTYQYSFSTIHWVLMTKEYYWRVFGKVHATDDDLKTLMTNEEFGKEAADSQK